MQAAATTWRTIATTTSDASTTGQCSQGRTRNDKLGSLVSFDGDSLLAANQGDEGSAVENTEDFDLHTRWTYTKSIRGASRLKGRTQGDVSGISVGLPMRWGTQ